MNGLGLYRLTAALIEPFAALILRGRTKRGKEDPARLSERLGHASHPRPNGAVIWLHGVSVGESLSLLPLIERIRAERPHLTLLVTSGTTTSAALLQKRLPAGVIHQYAPIDGPRSARRFLDHWRPAACLFAESELWPNLILGAQARGSRLMLVSARITERSAKGWASRPAAAHTLLSAFSLILPQDAESSARLTALGASPGPLFNLKLAGAPLECDEVERERLSHLIGRRKVVLAASTHPGEEDLIVTAFRSVPVGDPPALLILCPRHPDRGAAMTSALRGQGLNVARRTDGDEITPQTEIYVADTLGEMGLFLRLTRIAVMGGSFMDGIGGHNPLEPARLGRAVVAGSGTFNFETLYQDMLADETCGIRAQTPEELCRAIGLLLTDDDLVQRMGDAARAYAAQDGGEFETGWAMIRERLP